MNDGPTVDAVQFESVRQQLGTVQRDMGKLEGAVDRIEAVVGDIRLALARQPNRAAWLRDVALLLPLYALVADLISRGLH